jgi:NHLM bacteriocin system ABC transporter peptidase/ATP-binding protein
MAVTDTKPASSAREAIAAWLQWRPEMRRRAPTILQMEALECGAAALAMVLAYHGRHVPLEELRLACGVSRDGSKASNVLKAARRYGLVARGFRRDVGEFADLPLPAIIHWNFNHYVVLEGFGRRGAYLNDPAEGPRVVGMAEFGDSFTGVVLTFEPGPEFTRGGAPPRLAAALAPFLHGTKEALAFIAVASVALFVPGIAIPAFSRIFVDDILIGEFRDWLYPLLLGMAIAAGLRAGLTLLQQRSLMRLEQRLGLGLSARLLWHVLRLPIEFFGQRYPGDIVDRVAAADRIATRISGQLATNALSVVALVFYAAVMTAYDLTLTALAIAIALLNIVFLKTVTRRRGELNRTLVVDHGRIYGTTVDMIQTVESLKAAGLEQEAFARWAGFQAKLLGTRQGLAVYGGLTSILPALLDGLATAAVLGIGGFRVMGGAMTVGTLVAFQSLMASFMAPIGRLVNLAGSLQAIRADLDRVGDVMRYPVDPRAERHSPAEAGEVARLSGLLEVDGVTFGFNPFDPPLIDDFSLRALPGMRIALVGASGSGKSTLGRLICGLYRPWSGQVRIDGQSLDTIPGELLSSSLAYVDQDIFLFAASVRDNLSLWDGTAGDSEIAAALQDAAIDQDIATRAGRYDCAVLEGGSNFSGGQRQRLEIARAFMSRPTLIVLDEATAALDPVTEKQIDDAIRRLGCTCIIIAHRLSTIRDCDEIVVLESGKVVARGRHDDLLVSCGPYKALIGGE